MTMDILLLLAGLALIIYGANILVDGASKIARRAGISEFVIGLTIVGFGTSCPEFVVSLQGAIMGSSDVAIGNVIGSVVFNSLFILAITALLAPIAVTDENRRRDIPAILTITLFVILAGMSHTLLGIGESDTLSRWEGAILLCLFAAYLYLCFRQGGKESSAAAASDGKERKKSSLVVEILCVLGGLAGLVFGGRLFVDSGVNLAVRLGVSQKFIAITVLAIGTSLPELATNLVAIAKHRPQLALGNILGSNIFNLLLIFGTSSIVTELDFSRVDLVDMAALAASSLLILTGVYFGKKNLLDRGDAVIMLLAGIAYMAWMFVRL